MNYFYLLNLIIGLSPSVNLKSEFLKVHFFFKYIRTISRCLMLSKRFQNLLSSPGLISMVITIEFFLSLSKTSNGIRFYSSFFTGSLLNLLPKWKNSNPSFQYWGILHDSSIRLALPWPPLSWKII